MKLSGRAPRDEIDKYVRVSVDVSACRAFEEIYFELFLIGILYLYQVQLVFLFYSISHKQLVSGNYLWDMYVAASLLVFVIQ